MGLAFPLFCVPTDVSAKRQPLRRPSETGPQASCPFRPGPPIPILGIDGPQPHAQGPRARGSSAFGPQGRFENPPSPRTHARRKGGGGTCSWAVTIGYSPLRIFILKHLRRCLGLSHITNWVFGPVGEGYYLFFQTKGRRFKIEGSRGLGRGMIGRHGGAIPYCQANFGTAHRDHNVRRGWLLFRVSRIQQRGSDFIRAQ